MGRREVRVIVIRKWMTAVLLALMTGAMLALVYFLSGKAYANESSPLREWLAGILSGSRPPAADAILAGLMPLIANALLFVPWGFLLFLTLDSPARRRGVTHLMTFVCGLIFAAGIIVWQQYLPTRVTSYTDVAANALGALAGAIGGHLRKNLHVRFDF